MSVLQEEWKQKEQYGYFKDLLRSISYVTLNTLVIETVKVMSVKNVYGGLEKKKKLECMGHYQKGIGTRLRKLKKKDWVVVAG